MRTKLVLLCMLSVLLLPCLSGAVSAQSPDLAGKANDDTVLIAIEYYTAYPGTQKWITVWMENPVPVGGFSLLFQLTSDVARFSCDTSGQCFIDTTGCSASAFPYFGCLCEQNGSALRAMGLGMMEGLIPAGQGCLFRVRMDACCIPDADTLRNAYVLLAPATSSLADSLGEPIPWLYQMGELFVWWSVPGDASGDSLVDVGDVMFLVGYLFQETAPPCVCEAADCNDDGAVDIGDITYLINYLFLEGPPPLRGSASCWHEECWP